MIRESFLCRCAAWMPHALEQRSCCPSFLTGAVPSGMQVCVVTHAWWRLHWSMHRTGLQCFSGKNLLSLFPVLSSGWSGAVSPDGTPCSSAHIPGLCLSLSMPLTPFTSGVCSQPCLLQREGETKPSLWGRAGCGYDAQCRAVQDPRWPCLPPFSWLPGAAGSRLCWQGRVGSSCPFMCEERENTDW